MPRTITITTPENVRIEYVLAGLMSRGSAAIVDMLLQGLAVLVIVAVRSLLEHAGKWPGTTWASALLGIVIFLIVYGYFVYFETVWNGQTPGKRMVNLRAVREGGLPIDLSCAALRNLVRLVDLLPFFYVVGTIAVLLSARNKRLGDYAAGTLVVRELASPSLRETPIQSGPTESPAAPIPDGIVRNIELITPEEFSTARSFVERRAELEPYVREELAARIAGPMMRRVGMEDSGQAPYSAILAEIVDRCVRERGMR